MTPAQPSPRPPRLAASAVITDARGRVLLIQRGNEPSKGKWSVPGGLVEPGETLVEAARREAHEETGLRVAIGRELWCVTAPDGRGGAFEIHDFAATVTGGALCPGDDAADARWCTAEDLDALELTPNLRELFEGAGVIPRDPGAPLG